MSKQTMFDLKAFKAQIDQITEEDAVNIVMYLHAKIPSIACFYTWEDMTRKEYFEFIYQCNSVEEYTSRVFTQTDKHEIMADADEQISNDIVPRTAFMKALETHLLRKNTEELHYG